MAPCASGAENQAPVRVALSSRGSTTRVSTLSLPCAAWGDLLQRGAAVLAGLARGDADLDDLPVGKQAQ